jgi:hypothetical protein
MNWIESIMIFHAQECSASLERTAYVGLDLA